MNRVRRRQDLKIPPGWEEVKDMILQLNDEMRIAEQADDTGKSSQEQLWAVMRANWKRSRPVFEMRWRKKTMSNQLYEWIIKSGYADGELINMWRRPGYDRLCCLACIAKNTDHGGVCVCRVPRNQRPDKLVKCFHCGCPGCCSGDYSDPPVNNEGETSGS
jgi:bud site selection protein 31